MNPVDLDDSDFKQLWCTGSGYQIHIDQIMSQIKDHADDGGRVFIGTDSMPGIDYCIFATAICLHGGENQSGGRYFFKRIIEKDTNYANLNMRMIREVQDSIKIAAKVVEINPDTDIEIHADVGTSERSMTRGLVDSLKGWAIASGFSCRVKPHAWASASVADRHTKKSIFKL